MNNLVDPEPKTGSRSPVRFQPALRRRPVWASERRIFGLLIWGAAATAATLAVTVSIRFVDRPIAKLFYGLFGHDLIVRRIAGTPSFWGPFTILIGLAFLLRRAARRPLGYPDAVLAVCETSQVLTTLLSSFMKYVFGRTWPLYGNPSYLIDGAYGFSFFTADRQFAAFPSGHMASLCAVVGVLWATYPSFRPVYAIGAALTSIGLIVGNFHFASDVIAGALLGTLVAKLILTTFDFLTRGLFAHKSSLWE